MKPISALAVYAALVFVGAAAAAPAAYLLAQWAEPAWPWLAHHPFHRFLNRSLLLLALGGAWPLLRRLGVTSPRHLGWGGPPWPENAARFGLGWLAGAASMGALCWISLLAGAREMDAPAPHPLTTLGGAAAAGLAVGLIEEVLFRGILFGALRRVLDWRAALALSSLIYAASHFLSRARVAAPIEWHSGVLALGSMLRAFAEVRELFPGLLTLGLAGGLLGLVCLRSGSLHGAIGLHAGWVFWIKLNAAWSRPAAGAETGFWGGDKIFDGWFGLLALLAMLLLFVAWSEWRGAALQRSSVPHPPWARYLDPLSRRR